MCGQSVKKLAAEYVRCYSVALWNWEKSFELHSRADLYIEN
jgi:hypothetical protein